MTAPGTGAKAVSSRCGLGSMRAEELRSSDWTPRPPAGAGGSRAEEGESSPAPHPPRQRPTPTTGPDRAGGEVCPVPLTQRNRWATHRPEPPAPRPAPPATPPPPPGDLDRRPTNRPGDRPSSHTHYRRPSPASLALLQAGHGTIGAGRQASGGDTDGRIDGTWVAGGMTSTRGADPTAHHPMGGWRPAGRSPAGAPGRPVGGSTKSNTVLSPTPSTNPADTGGRGVPLGNPQATVAPTGTEGVTG